MLLGRLQSRQAFIVKGLGFNVEAWVFGIQVYSFCRSHGLHAEEQEWLNSIVLKEMASRNLLTLVDEEGIGGRRPQAIETLQGSSRPQQHERWLRRLSKASNEPLKGSKTPGSADAPYVLPKGSEVEVHSSEVHERPLQSRSPGTEMQERGTLYSSVEHWGIHQETCSLLAGNNSSIDHEYKPFEHNDFWDVPLPASTDLPGNKAKGTPPSIYLQPQPQRQQQQELYGEQKCETKQGLRQQQQHHQEQFEHQQPQQLPTDLPHALRNVLSPAAIAAAEKTPPQRQQHQQLVEKTGEEDGKKQKQQRLQETPSTNENRSLRCLSIFPPEAAEAVRDSPNSSSNCREVLQTPSSDESWGWLSPVATERNP